VAGVLRPVLEYQRVKINLGLADGREVAIGNRETPLFAGSAFDLCHSSKNLGARGDHQMVKDEDWINDVGPTGTPECLIGTGLSNTRCNGTPAGTVRGMASEAVGEF
jgi:hypothetical protein